MNNHSKISVRTLTAMALLIAMSIVFSRVLSISTGFVRFNLGSLPVLLAGILFGPWAGFESFCQPKPPTRPMAAAPSVMSGLMA